MKKIYFNGYMLDSEQWQDLDVMIASGRVGHRELENKRYSDVLMFDENCEDEVLDLLAV